MEDKIEYDKNDYGDLTLKNWEWGMFNKEKCERYKKLLNK